MMTNNQKYYREESENICAWEESVLVPTDVNIPFAYKKKQKHALPKSSLPSMKRNTHHQ